MKREAVLLGGIVLVNLVTLLLLLAVLAVNAVVMSAVGQPLPHRLAEESSGAGRAESWQVDWRLFAAPLVGAEGQSSVAVECAR